uniref:Uncharacterized LOC108940374 n=1 Tax=Scleropages formosus TaxID=113540 RepID=A0A8C9WPG0_SCLFO
MDSTVAEEMQGVITSVVTPEKNATLDFSQVSCSQLGISPQSFVLSAKAKDKSRLSKLKVRRRSSVGVRGSPETNALIRFIAQKRRQTPPSTPQVKSANRFLCSAHDLCFQELSSECTELDDAIYQSSADSPMLSTSSDSGQTQCQPVACSGDPSRNKKRVRFGAPLSPEFFDKNLPPSTPLQKGGTPAHASTSAGPQLRPLLKTPQRSTSHFPQPDFTSPVMGDLPTSSEGPGCAEAQFDPGEHQDENGQEVCLCPSSFLHKIWEDLRFRAVSIWSIFGRFSLNPSHLQASTNVVVKKRTSRNAAISAAKKLCKKKRWGNKEVDRSLYGKRDYASKNPALSPITEALSSASRSPTPQRHHSGNRLLGTALTETPQEADHPESMADRPQEVETLLQKHKVKSGAQGRVRGRRSSRVQPSLILDEAVVLGTQVDASAAELVNSVEPKGPEDPNVLGREMRKEGLLAQGCDLEKSVPCGNCSLPEWAQFSIEDVLQPLPRTQRCVRRSLRNQCSADSAEAGLAWVLHVSPAPSKPLHRRTKGCPTPTCPEEPAL